MFLLRLPPLQPTCQAACCCHCHITQLKGVTPSCYVHCRLPAATLEVGVAGVQVHSELVA
jgi:hypothetical protein